MRQPAVVMGWDRARDDPRSLGSASRPEITEDVPEPCAAVSGSPRWISCSQRWPRRRTSRWLRCRQCQATNRALVNDRQRLANIRLRYWRGLCLNRPYEGHDVCLLALVRGQHTREQIQATASTVPAQVQACLSIHAQRSGTAPVPVVLALSRALF